MPTEPWQADMQRDIRQRERFASADQWGEEIGQQNGVPVSITYAEGCYAINVGGYREGTVRTEEEARHVAETLCTGPVKDASKPPRTRKVASDTLRGKVARSVCYVLPCEGPEPREVVISELSQQERYELRQLAESYSDFAQVDEADEPEGMA